ncbi:type II secretion system protein [Sporosarcina ureae]|uniref:type II secretion system protein n=1 Tax=Sporosarcina ureae TaxID=1571 RepID=UPI000A17C051|nr:type II secretion system protein [Sporosarcina ureae]ARK20446.1 hypothetical protein SporoP32a_02115 [Sporosarcina ureae]
MKEILADDIGMTLVKLLAILVIMGITSVTAISSMILILENTRIKAEKTNAILLKNTADLYFIEHQTTYVNSVGMSTLISEGYFEDFNLVNDTFWVAEA